MHAGKERETTAQLAVEHANTEKNAMELRLCKVWRGVVVSVAFTERVFFRAANPQNPPLLSSPSLSLSDRGGEESVVP